MPRVPKDIEEEPVEDIVVDTPDHWLMHSPLEYEKMPEYHEYLYDGELIVWDGKVYVPRKHPEWAQRLLHLGYTWDGEQPKDFSYDF